MQIVIVFAEAILTIVGYVYIVEVGGELKTRPTQIDILLMSVPV